MKAGKREGESRKRKKRRDSFIQYDYEAAYTQSMEDMHEWIVERMAEHGKAAVYALKEIRAGEQMEVEMYPLFRRLDDIPAEGRRERKDNSAAQRNLNDKNSRKRLERKLNENFGDGDIWATLTHDDAHLPPDGDMDAADRIMRNYISRINYQRRKRGLPNAKYIYVIEYSRTARIRWHYHIVMDGLMDMDTVEKCWKNGSRNELRRIKKDENGLSGIANYIAKQKERLKSEKRWRCSKGLKEPAVRVVHSRQPQKGKGSYKKIEKYVKEMVKNQNIIREQMEKWYPDYDFTDAQVYYNSFNYMFYIHARMRKRRAPEYEAGREKT